jgi:predicted RNA binding protein YcfA (HicA-like mRNA interferase family)
MKLPRDLAGGNLIRHLCSKWGYRQVHQVGSHVTLETDQPSLHRIVVPVHAALRVGTRRSPDRGCAAQRRFAR